MIEANRRDQVVGHYGSFDQLLEYCQLSAAPVGELVLHVFGAATPERIALSDKICAALQVIEHLGDLEEDRARGRLYIADPEDAVKRAALYSNRGRRSSACYTAGHGWRSQDSWRVAGPRSRSWTGDGRRDPFSAGVHNGVHRGGAGPMTQVIAPPTLPAIEVDMAYGACEEITRREAANFYYGIRLLPRDKRRAMSAVYAFARRVDDIGDGDDERRRSSPRSTRLG